MKHPPDGNEEINGSEGVPEELELFEALFQHASEAAFVVDANNVVVRINPAAKSLAGDIIGRQLEEFITPGEGVGVLHRADGGEQAIHWRSTPAGESGKRLVFVQTIDEGNKKPEGNRTPLLSHEPYDILLAMIRSAVDSIFCKDLERRYTLVNPAMEKLLGRPVAEIVGYRAEDIFAPEAMGSIQEVDSAALAGEVVSGVYTIPVGDAMLTFHVVQAPLRDEQNRVRGICGIVRDVTQVKKVEQALRESEEKFRALAEDSPDVIMRFDRQLRHLYVNQAVEAQTNIPPADFIGKTHQELGFPADLCELWEKALEKTFEKKETQRVEFQLPGGTWIDWLLVPEQAADGSVPAVMTTARDVSDLKATQAELVKALDQAHEVERLKDDFMSHMSHEVRTPINHIVGLATLLKMKQAKINDADAEEYLNIIIHSANNLLKTITTMLELSEITNGVRQPDAEQVALRNLVSSVFEKFTARAEAKTLKFNLQFGDDLPNEIEIDREKFTHILKNLLDNAIKFTHNGYVELYVGMDGPMMLMRVKDSGIGIPKELSEQVFSPFFQVDMTPSRKFYGVGLGLTMVREYTKFLGGRVELESHPGEGSTFSLYFPLQNS